MKTKMKALSAAVGAATALSSTVAAEAVQTPVIEVSENTAAYTPVANVTGAFSFHQDTITPTDDIFSLFGTVATGMCAKPNFAFEDDEEASYFINVSGSLQKQRTFTKAELESMTAAQRRMVCSCSTGEALAQATVTGVPVSSILELVHLDDDANVITFRSSDGYAAKLPLSYVLDKEALLVYKINGEDVPTQTQIWMSGTVASYFTRQVASIEVSSEAEVPEVKKADADRRVKLTLANTADSVIEKGEVITFTGYADDYGTPITAIEFSMDDGKTWTVCETPDANAENWICWTFDWKAENAGDYKMTIRARNSEGETSPLAASVAFTVR